MGPLNGTVLALLGIALVIGYALAGYSNGMFWPVQVIAKWQKPGIALIIHGGMWGDLLLLPLVVRYLTDRYDLTADLTWESNKWWVLIGFAITLANHINLCLNQKVPDPFGWQDKWWSMTITVHFLYMWGACTILLKAAFAPSIEPAAMAILAIVVGTHMMFGIHMVLGITNRFMRLDWLPEFITTQSILMEVGIWSALIALAYYLGKETAALPVLVVGVSWVAITAVVAVETQPVVY